MRSIAFVIALGAVFIAGTLVPAARTQEAGPTPRSVVMVHYMKVKPGQREDYLRVERNLWKPAHELLAKEKRIQSWSLYEIKPLPAPGQTSPPVTEYDFVTFTVHDPSREFAKYENAALSAVHPDKTIDDITRRTLGARDTVRREEWRLVEDVR
jgi:hypothetical protein